MLAIDSTYRSHIGSLRANASDPISHIRSISASSASNTTIPIFAESGAGVLQSACGLLYCKAPVCCKAWFPATVDSVCDLIRVLIARGIQSCRTEAVKTHNRFKRTQASGSKNTRLACFGNAYLRRSEFRRMYRHTYEYMNRRRKT